MNKKLLWILVVSVLLIIGALLAIKIYENNFSSDGSTEPSRLWAYDSIALMKIVESGDLGCFGCGNTMCIDPIPSNIVVEETQNLHCDEDFNVVRIEPSN